MLNNGTVSKVILVIIFVFLGYFLFMRPWECVNLRSTDGEKITWDMVKDCSY